MDFDRETVASAFVATGGAWLLGSAAFRRRSGRWNSAQLRGMTYAGVGFLLSAASARWLQHLGNRGIAVSLVGTMLAMRGMYTLLRERAALSASSTGAKPTALPATPRDAMDAESVTTSSTGSGNAVSSSPATSGMATNAEPASPTAATPDASSSHPPRSGASE